MESKKIPLKEFISRLENNSNAALKECIRENTQFSTRFVINDIIARNEKQLDNLFSDKTIKTTTMLPEQWLDQVDWKQMRAELRKDFDLDNLNFLEANQLARRMNEHLIMIYQSIQKQISGAGVKKVLAALIGRLHDANSRLRKEHMRLSTKP